MWLGNAAGAADSAFEIPSKISSAMWLSKYRDPATLK
jgi:hypothetical protein